ncbi:hypothetical protein D3C79_692030 [compost metagenome]
MSTTIEVPCPVTDDVAAPVLTNEEVLHEAGRFHLGRDIPWHGYTEHEYKAANPGKPQYPSPFLVDNEPGECRRPHKHQGQRPFGKQAQPETCEHQVGIRLAGALHPTPETVAGQQNRERQNRVSQHNTAGDQAKCGAGKNNGSPDAGVTRNLLRAEFDDDETACQVE